MNLLDKNVLLEIMKGNPKFAHLINSPFITTDNTLAQLYMDITKKTDEEQARYWFKKLSYYSKNIDKDILIKALKFQKTNKKIPSIDAINYIYARENNLKLITCNSTFKNKNGVEYICPS